MEDMDNAGLVLNIINNIFFVLFSYYSNFKFSNQNLKWNSKEIVKILIIIVVAAIFGALRNEVNYLVNIISILIITYKTIY